MFGDYLKKINNLKKGKIIVLSAVGIVFLFLFFYSVWQQYFKDALIEYIPDSAVIYIHFSLPTINQSAGLEASLNQILQDGGMAGFSFSDIKREVGIVGQIKDQKLNFSFLIRTDRPLKLERFLKQRNLSFKFLRYDLALVGNSDSLGDFVKNKKNQIILKTKGRFSLFDSVKVYFSRDAISYFTDDLIKLSLAFLTPDNRDLFLRVKAKKGILKIYFSGQNTLNVRKDKASLPSENNSELAVSGVPKDILDSWEKNLKISSPQDFPLWQNYLKRWESRYGIGLNSGLIKRLADERMVFLLSKANANNPPFLFSRDFYLSIVLKQPLLDGEIKELENVLKHLMAWAFPREKIIRLSDGTKIVELVPDISRFAFGPSGSVAAVSSPDGNFKIFYKTAGNFLAISNNLDLLNHDFYAVSGDYLKINRDLLPSDAFWRYLNKFDWVEFYQGELVLR